MYAHRPLVSSQINVNDARRAPQLFPYDEYTVNDFAEMGMLQIRSSVAEDAQCAIPAGCASGIRVA